MRWAGSWKKPHAENQKAAIIAAFLSLQAADHFRSVTKMIKTI
jgi:hypothetical protein